MNEQTSFAPFRPDLKCLACGNQGLHRQGQTRWRCDSCGETFTRRQLGINPRAIGRNPRQQRKARPYTSPDLEVWELRALPWAEYVLTEHWAGLKHRVVADRGWRCEKCGDEGGSLDLHHLIYDRVGEERLEDVQLLCRPCHFGGHEEKESS